MKPSSAMALVSAGVMSAARAVVSASDAASEAMIAVFVFMPVFRSVLSRCYVSRFGIQKRKVRRTVPQAGDTPDTHQRVKNHGRPERDAGESVAKGGESEEGGNEEVVNQHCGDQPGRRATLRVGSRQPAGNTQSQQRRPAYASHGQRGGFLQSRADEKRHRYRRIAQQRQPGSQFDQRTGDLQAFHGGTAGQDAADTAKTLFQSEIEGRTVLADRPPGNNPPIGRECSSSPPSFSRAPP